MLDFMIALFIQVKPLHSWIVERQKWRQGWRGREDGEWKEVRREGKIESRTEGRREGHSWTEELREAESRICGNNGERKG